MPRCMNLKGSGQVLGVRTNSGIGKKARNSQHPTHTPVKTKGVARANTVQTNAAITGNLPTNANGNSDAETVVNGERDIVDTSTNSRTEWDIDAVLLGSGNMVGGQIFKKGTWYGCTSKVRDTSSYFPIEVASLSAPRVGFRSVGFEAVAVAANGRRQPPRQCVIPGPRALRHMDSDRFDRSALNTVIHFCKRFPGVSVKTGVCGARERNPKLERFMVHGREELVGVSGSLDCIPASIVNGVHALLGHEAAIRARDSLVASGQRPTSVGRAGPLVQGLKMRLNLRKCRDAKRISDGGIDEACEIVGNFKSGVWLVRLFHDSIHLLDHCIMVNAYEGFILDSAESFPIRLCPESLRMCGGDDTPKLKVIEVKELVVL